MKNIDEASLFLKEKGFRRPKICIIAGTGLDDLVKEADKITEVSYSDIPHFPVSTVGTHKGTLLLGSIQDVEVIFMRGRFHLYEGYRPEDIAFPVRVMASLGVRLLIVTNAAGGVNPSFAAGDIMSISDHINFTGENPLVGKNHDEIGPRFPVMADAYDSSLIEIFFHEADNLGVKLKSGVYLGLKGPSMETDAEYRMVGILGGDAVGMSTVTEVIAAVHAGMKVSGFSVITNQFGAENDNGFGDVVKVAEKGGRKLGRLISEAIKALDNHIKNT